MVQFGTLAKNVSFLLVPSLDPIASTAGFESANVRFDNIRNSPWLNVKFGKLELDGPLSEKRMMTLSKNGGCYQLYHYVPFGGQDINDFTVGENQLGIELVGHSLDDHSRYSASWISGTNGELGLPGGWSYDGMIHLSQAFMAGKLGLQRVGVYGVAACWKCHGQQGRGNGPSASRLTDSKDQPIRPYNFATAHNDARFKCGVTNEDLYRIFMTGVDGTPMPSFADVIQANDAWDLVHFLRTLQIDGRSKENAVLKGAGGPSVLKTPETKSEYVAPADPDRQASPGGH